MHKKIFLNLLFVLLVGSTIIGLLSYRTIAATYNKGVEDKLTSSADLIADIISDRLDRNGLDNINEYVRKINSAHEIRITIISYDGIVLADTEEDIAVMDNHKNRPEVINAISGMKSMKKRYSDTIKADYLYYALSVPNNNGYKVVVRLSMPLRDIELIKRKYIYDLIKAFIAGLLIALAIGYSTSKRIANPISKIIQVSEEISKGKFDLKLRIKGNDEIVKLASTINKMSEQLQFYINGLNSRNKEMEAILSSVINGIIAIDNDQRILFINEYAKKLLDIEDEDLEGLHLIYVLRNHQIQEYLRSTIENNKFEETEITFTYPKHRNIKLYTNPIIENDGSNNIGIIITLQDVTQIRKLESIRSEFVANVSHELKTPLTSIKGFVETLKEGAIRDERNALRFLDIIDHEVERLVELSSDILTLSELEGKKEKKKKEIFDIETSLDEVISVFKSQIEKKNIFIEKSIQESMGYLSGSKDKFKQMMINLIDNAIKYSNNGRKIIIQGYLEESCKIIAVEDFGVGIPAEDLPRIFERFYRVDKARLRTGEGGTGLGLAIVKHIAVNFGAEISVESQIGKGTKFIIRFPFKRSLDD